MLSLIKKDFFLIKANLKSMLIILIAYLFIAINGHYDLSFMLIFISMILFISTFSYDDYNNWNAYAITLPIKRSTIVKSKYVATLILMLVTTILGIIISTITSLINNTFDIELLLSSMIGYSFSVILTISLMYPLIFKYGSEKGRILIFAILFILAAILGLVSTVIDTNQLVSILDAIEKYLYFILPVISIALLLISYRVSSKIYQKKEF